jgi:molybdopterin synthase sulfur carrier subunit
VATSVNDTAAGTVTVWIPPLLRNLTQGTTQLTVVGKTVGEVIAALDQIYPGIAGRLLEGDRLRPGIALVVDGVVSTVGLRHRLMSGSEVHFLPALSGG